MIYLMTILYILIIMLDLALTGLWFHAGAPGLAICWLVQAILWSFTAYLNVGSRIKKFIKEMTHNEME